jgi:hypothetical protein
MSECGIFFRFTRNSTAILVAFGFVLGLALSYPQKIQAQSLGEVVITNRYANIRSGPGTNYRRIGRSMRGERFMVTEIRPKWYRIIYNQRSGWVYADLVRLQQASQQEADRLVEEVQTLGKRIDGVLEKLGDASNQLTEWVEKTSPARPGEAEAERKTRQASMRKPISAGWALVPGGPRLASGEKLTGGALLGATAGCLALGLYYYEQHKDYMMDYRRLTPTSQPEEFDRLHDKAQNRLKLSDSLLYAAAGLYLFNIVDHFYILPRFGSALTVEIENTDQAPDCGERIHLSLSRSF